MDKKPRLGSNPLEEQRLPWIKDSRKEKSKHSKQSKRSKKGKRKNDDIPSIKKGLKPGFSRATLIIKDKYLEKIKALAYWERKTIEEVTNEALEKYLKGKKIKPLRKEVS